MITPSAGRGPNHNRLPTVRYTVAGWFAQHRGDVYEGDWVEGRYGGRGLYMSRLGVRLTGGCHMLDLYHLVVLDEDYAREPLDGDTFSLARPEGPFGYVRLTNVVEATVLNEPTIPGQRGRLRLDLNGGDRLLLGPRVVVRPDDTNTSNH
jgi:hypothetical protein